MKAVNWLKLTGRILFGQILQLVKDGVGRRFWQQRRFAFVLTLQNQTKSVVG